MPLRDHFRPPISTRSSWEGFHGMWPGEMVRRLFPYLPDGYTAEPRVHLGHLYELDVNAYESTANDETHWKAESNHGGIATLTVPAPTLTFEADLADEYEYEVLIFDESRNRKLVAAVEIVSPGNKDRAESRRAFVSKCAALLQQKSLCVHRRCGHQSSIQSLFELLEMLDQTDPAFSTFSPTYAVTLRGQKRGLKSVMESWAYTLNIGQPMPSLPIWLTDDRMILLELEESYEETCRILKVS